MDHAMLQDLVMGKIEDLPPKARRVAEYLLANMREAAFRSIGEVAEELRVSKAQLVRVARMLGFSGYSELKDALQGAILEQVNPAAMLARAIDSQEDLPETIHRMEHANLDDTWTQLSPPKVAEFCTLVQEARSIHCMGWGISCLVAESLQMRLRVMGLDAYMVKRGDLTLLEQARTIRSGDLLMVCELPSYVVEVTESAEMAADRGAKLITISDSPAAPVCRRADLPFFVSASSPTFGSSILGPLFLVHVLTSVLAVEMGDRSREALEEQARFLHDERLFHPIFGLRY
jgi:DNA-binding MurR/RpiR family transcriptional regulator